MKIKRGMIVDVELSDKKKYLAVVKEVHLGGELGDDVVVCFLEEPKDSVIKVGESYVLSLENVTPLS